MNKFSRIDNVKKIYSAWISEKLNPNTAVELHNVKEFLIMWKTHFRFICVVYNADVKQLLFFGTHLDHLSHYST